MSAQPSSREHAVALDETDALASYRRQFELPKKPNGKPFVYLCGHSLGLAPRAALDLVSEELADWSRLGVLGHHAAQRPWIEYHNFATRGLQHVAGAQPNEVVAMNSLTINLHLMMASFYRPTRERHKILIEAGAFSSDHHAVAAQIAWHGFDPNQSLVLVSPRPGEDTLRSDDINDAIAQAGTELALVLWPGVQYRTGQAFDCGAIVSATHRAGAIVGFDMAHAIGNLPLSLHDWDADFAVWCSYKYLNAGPGAIGGCFVHERHVARNDLPRLAGWWGHDPATRFQMRPEFTPSHDAAGWATSNPPIFSTAPLLASLDLFRSADIGQLRAKSQALTRFAGDFIRSRLAGAVTIVTPLAEREHGCQLSLRIAGNPMRGRRVFDALADRDVVCDWREPDIIRVAPVPLYNTFVDVDTFCTQLEASVREIA
jgi:kynureninase